MDSDTSFQDCSKFKTLKQILNNESKVPSYIQRLYQLKDIFGIQRIFDQFLMDNDNASIHTQRLLIHKVLNYISQCEDINTLLLLIDFLILWSSPKNKALYLTQDENIPELTKQQKDSWNVFRARFINELTTLDQKFVSNLNLKKLSSNMIKLITAIQKENDQQVSFQIQEDLNKILELHKQRVLIETSEMARELRDTQSDNDSHLMILESLQMQLSQVQSLDLQIKFFYKKLQPVFINVCQHLIQIHEDRIAKGIIEYEEEDDEKEVLLSVSKILETIISPTEYLVKIKSQQGQDQVYIYKDKDYKSFLQQKSKKLYKAFAFGINALITRVKSYKLQVSCLRLLKRFYEIFEKHQTVLEDTILTCLQNFADIEDVKKHKIAALFFYHLLNSFETNDQFKKKLKEAKELEILKYNPHFSSIFYIHQIEQDGPVSLNNIHIKSGFPLEYTLQPKQNYKQYLYVQQPNSILHYNFTTQEYNIGFSVEKVGQLKLVQGGWEEVNNEEGSVILQKPGVYKVIWHNSYSYLKAKVMKYRLRILNKKESGQDEKLLINQSHLSLEDLFTINELTEREDIALRALKSIYSDHIPIIRIIRPQSNSQIEKNKEQALVLLIEENRSYLKICKDLEVSIQKDEIQTSDIYVQQLNQREFDQIGQDYQTFYSDDSQISQVFIITKQKQYPTSAFTNNSHFSPNNKQELKDYVIRSEKILYYTLDKTNFKQKINLGATFYFADAVDSLITIDIINTIKQQKQKKGSKLASLYSQGETTQMLLMDLDKEKYLVRDISDVNYYAKRNQNSLHTSLDQNIDIAYQMNIEFFQMIFSYLKIGFNISQKDIQIYEDDSAIEIPEIEDKIYTMREEVLRLAPILKDIYQLFRKGASQNL